MFLRIFLAVLALAGVAGLAWVGLIVMPLFLPDVLTIVIALALGVYAAGRSWAATADGVSRATRGALIGAVLVGALGAVLGLIVLFLAPPDPKQGPLYALFLATGCGVLFGAAGGYIWRLRRGME
ncbi:MAG: hypothetical protein V2I63_05575 [Pseudomonadales bacterium]|jgi:hypothetical protein|nr:hypothetical protein [Pseudomonadales bacterium]